ncbi:hypothetical protein ACTXM8_16505, partial [Brachybacterium alimentarium]|uniref:hypothetical protein n=1 Tax=Brachybacterium alimentarium TaxID=47845 RepID=UPI003FCFDE8E
PLNTRVPSTHADAVAPAPPWRAKLPPRAYACGFCGVAVSAPRRSSLFLMTPMSAARSGRLIEYHGGDFTFASCESCTERHQETARIIAAHPTLRARFGTNNAQHQLSSALDGCAALGVPFPTGLARNRDLTVTVMMMMRQAGGKVRWLRMYAPIMTSEAPLSSCATAPWAHVDEGSRAELRAAFEKLLGSEFALGQKA